MERLTPKDTAILRLEDDISAAHGLTVGVFNGPEPDFDALRARVAERVPLVPRYKQRLVEVPLDLERPVWVNDPNFSVEFHVRHKALPAKRKSEGLQTLIGQLLSQRIDRGKPLWSLHVVSGLPKKQWALISKVHYSILDGVSGTDLLGVLADDIDSGAGVRRQMPDRLPTNKDLVVDAVADLALNPMESYRVSLSLARRPMRAMKRLAAGLQPRNPDRLGDAIGPHRRWAYATVSLADLRKIRDANGCSTTDVILAAIAGGVHAHLVAAGKPIPAEINALVPLSVGAASGGYSGQITTLTATLPLTVEDPQERLRHIHTQTSAGAAKTGAIAGTVLRRQGNFVAPTIMGQGVRATMLEARDRRDIDTVAINVPGPAETIEILGKPMVEAYPVIPLPGRVRLAFAVLSLGDELQFGVTGDWDTTTDLEPATAGISNTVADLLD